MISVALCTYNGKQYLEQQLNSILNQTTPINEVVICDDGSSDSTIEIVNKFKSIYPSIIKLHINTISLGPIKNFERAINLCQGELIFLSDHDDIWKPNKVEVISKRFKRFTFLEAIFTDGEIIDDNNNFTGKTLWDTLTFDLEIQENWSSGNALLEIIHSRNKITGATLAIKKSLFLRAFPFPIIKGIWHDAWLGIHAAANGTLGWVDQPLIQYRVHSSQQVGIGNGVTFSPKNEKKSYYQKILEEKEFYSNCIFMIDKITNLYPNLNKDIIKLEASEKLNWINFRLNLSPNLLVRFFKISKNKHLYQNNTFSPTKAMIKDFLTVA